MQKSRLKGYILSALFAGIISICAWITVPAPIPFTMQTFGVFISLFVLGGRLGTLSIAVYVLLGLIGLPVFSGFVGGIGALFGATGGYILGFLALGLVFILFERLLPKKQARIIGIAVGLMFCYLFGTLWYCVFYAAGKGFLEVLAICVVPYIIPDIIKAAVGLWISKRLLVIKNNHYI